MESPVRAQCKSNWLHLRIETMVNTMAKKDLDRKGWRGIGGFDY